MAETMLAAVYEGPGQVGLAEVSLPEVPPGWALIEVDYAGICGTDLAIFSGSHPRARAPLILGHEFAGRIRDPGNGAAPGLKPGQRVVVEPLISCGHCQACRSGNAHVCKSLRLFGIDAPGGMAQFMAVPPERLHPVPEDLSSEEAAALEPLAVAVHAVRLSAFRPGDRVAVLGAGPIGLLTALVLKASGAARVMVSETNPHRLELACTLGFTAIDAADHPIEKILTLTGDEGADLVFDAAGHPAVAEGLVAACRVRGEIVLVGIYKKPAPLDLQGIAFKELSVKGSRVYTPEDFRIAGDLAASGQVELKRLISHLLPLDEVAQGFALAAGGGEAVKVMFRVSQNR